MWVDTSQWEGLKLQVVEYQPVEGTYTHNNWTDVKI